MKKPSLLTMARTAVRAWYWFFTSGCETLPKEQRECRYNTCKQCSHLCRMRCMVCGCFVAVKTWLPKENCPNQLW